MSTLIARITALAQAIGADIKSLLTRALQSAAPAAPAAGNLVPYGRDYAGRPMSAAIGADGIEQLMQPLLGRRSIVVAAPVANASTMTFIGLGNPIAIGTTTTASFALTSRYTQARRLEYLATTASASAVAGLRWSAHNVLRGSAGQGGFHLVWRFGPATGVATSSHRLFVGLTGSTGAPSDVSPGTLTNILGVGYDAGDTQLHLFANDSTGSATKTPLGVAFPKPSADRSAIYELALYCAPGGTAVGYEVTDLVTGAVARGSLDSDLPAANQPLIPNAWISVGGTSSVIGLAHMGLYLESDL